MSSKSFSAKGVVTRQSGGLPHSPARPRPEPHLVLSHTLASTGLLTGVPATDLLTDVPAAVLGLVGGTALLQRRRTT